MAPRDETGGRGEPRLEPWLRASPEMLCLASADGWLIDVNSAWTAALGWSEAELCGRPYLDFIHPEDHGETLAAAGRLHGGEAVARFVNRWRRSDGTHAALEWNASGGPQPGVVFAAVRDVTHAQRAGRLAAAVEEASGVGSWEYEPDTGAIFWSPTTFRIKDMEPTDPQPDLDGVYRFFTPESREALSGAVARLIDRDEPYALDLTLITAKGRRILVFATGTADRRAGKLRRIYGTLRDVTAERDRSRRLDRLLAVAQHSANAILLLDADGAVNSVNAAFTGLTGMSAAALEKVEPGGEGLGRLLAPGPAREEVALRAVDGEALWLRVDRIDIANGRLVIGADVTAMKRNEARLAAAEAEARAAAEGLSAALGVLEDGFALYDAEDRLVLCNDAYRRVYAESAAAIRPGACFEDILRHGLSHGQYPDAAGREDAWMAERLAQHRGPGCDEIQALPGDRWVRVRERPTPTGGRAGLRTDVTESVRTRRRLEAILDGTGAGVWEWDIDRRLVSFDTQWVGGRDPGLPTFSEWAILDWLRRVHPADLRRVREAMAAHLAGETDHYACQVRIRRSDGGWRWNLDRGRVCVRDAAGRALRVAGVRIDLTEIKAVEEALELAVRDAEAANEAKSLFLANMSHEIRTPLTSVIGYTRLLAEQPELSEASRDFVRRAASGCDALLATVNDVLDFSKLEAGQISLAPVPTGVAALLRDAAELFAVRAADKGLAMACEGLDALPPALLVDPDRLRQIALNLLGNAVKFTETGGVTVRADWDAATRRLSVTVRDTGPGIPPEGLSRLFRRFSQSDETITRRHGGTGLGLAICKGLAEAMGGEIGCESALGIGSAFRITLPAEAVALPAPPADAAAPRPPTSLAGVRVLVGEDNEVLREFIVAAIARAGGQVQAVEDGEDVLRVAARAPFDAIVLDHRMQRMDGDVAAAELRRRPGPNQCAALVLVSADVEAVGRATLEDFDAAIAKPVNPEELAATIAGAL